MKSLFTYGRSAALWSVRSASWQLTLALLLPGAFTVAGGTVRIFPAPAGEPLSSDFTVTADGQNVPVFVTTVATADPESRMAIYKPNDLSYADHTSLASFDLSDPVKVTVTVPGPVHSVKLSPASSGITPQFLGDQITFVVARPQQLALEVNGDWVHALQLFANAPEMDAPRPGDPNVLYFGPGIHTVDGVRVTSGQTVYLAGGAIVYGAVLPGTNAGATFSLTGSNIVFRGRGILDGSRTPLHMRSLIAINATNVVLDGIIVRDSSGWTIPIRQSDHVSVNNIKLFGVRANSDGIDICNSRHVTVAHSYLRTMDDLVVVKTLLKGGGESADIDVHDCVLWNEIAHALSVGAELRDNVERVHFHDCDIIHDKGREWLLRVYHCDAADIHDVTFDHIRIEESKRFISLWIGSAIWGRDAERGHIENIVFRNIQAVGPDPLVELHGFDAGHAISGVRFENILRNGRPLTTARVKQNEFVHNVTVTP